MPVRADKLLIKLPRWAGRVPATQPRGRTSRPNDTLRVSCNMSHVHPWNGRYLSCQPVPDQLQASLKVEAPEVSWVLVNHEGAQLGCARKRLEFRKSIELIEGLLLH